MTTKISRRQ